MVTIRRVEFVDRRKLAGVAPDKSFLSDNGSESFENTCLGLVGYQVPLQNLRPPQLIKKAKWLGLRAIVWKACADAKPPHPSHEFRNFAYLLAPDSAAELSKW